MSQSTSCSQAIPHLSNLNLQERGEFAQRLLQEQVLEQRTDLHFWRDLTGQPAQIDTGYVAQHLVSIVTGIRGVGFRGKGDDLADGSEVKSANFLDSLDRQGATAPRWNFSCNDEEQMTGLLNYPAIYLVSMDFNQESDMRFRVWKLLPRLHRLFRDRYVEWMEKLGYPKLADSSRPGVNFQLFPPRMRTTDNFARHGNNRKNGFKRLRIPLDDGMGARLIFHAESYQDTIRRKIMREWNP